MKRFLITVLLAVAATLFCSTYALGGWVITYPDTTVEPNSTVEYRLFGEWDLGLVVLAVPTVVRELDPGAFWTGTLPVDTMGGTPTNIQWNWAVPNWANLIQEFRCGVPSGCPAEGDIGYDGVSPDHFSISAQGMFNEDPAPAGRDFLSMTFDVTGTAGRFEFDTACFTFSLNTIYMLDVNYQDHGCNTTGLCDMLFTKGTITVGAADPGDADTVIIDLTSAYRVDNVAHGDSALVVPIFIDHDNGLSGFEITALYTDPLNQWMADYAEFKGGWASAPDQGITVTQNSPPTESEVLLWAKFTPPDSVDPVTARDTVAYIHFKLGLALKHLGRLRIAAEHFQRAISLDGNLNEARINLEIILKELKVERRK